MYQNCRSGEGRLFTRFTCPFLVPETRKFHRKRGSYFFCLVPRVPVWYRACLSGTGDRHSLLFIYVSNYDVTTESATIPATSEGSRDVKENIIGMFLFKMHISTRYEKNNQVPMLNPDRQISVSGDTMSHRT